jgi:hypothetical protein
MNMKFVIVSILYAVLLMTACQNKVKASEENNLQLKENSTFTCDAAENFGAQDSGSFHGPIIHFVDTTSMRATGTIHLLSANGDTIKFEYSASDVKNLDATTLIVGTCITVKYHAEIFREEGEEVGRSFYIIEIKFENLKVHSSPEDQSLYLSAGNLNRNNRD